MYSFQQDQDFINNFTPISARGANQQPPNYSALLNDITAYSDEMQTNIKINPFLSDQPQQRKFDIFKCKVPLSLNPNYIFKGNLRYGENKGRTAKQRMAETNLLDNQHKNVLSEKARKNISFALNWLYTAAKPKYVWDAKSRKTFSFKVNFITLTIPSITGDIRARQYVEEKISEDGKLLENPNYSLFEDDLRTNVVDEIIFQKCLNQFLTYCRKYYKLGNYVWKVEAQINGQLHIHLSTDQYIKYQDIRRTWNRILTRNGLLDAYFNKHQNFDPPSTDVHSTKEMYNAIAYIGGYMKKDPNFCKTYKGRIWGCSSGLSPKNKVRVEMNFQEWQQFRKELLSGQYEWNECLLKDKEGKVVGSAGFLFKLKKHQCFKIYHPSIKKAYLDHRQYIQSLTPKQKSEYMVVDLFGELSVVKEPDSTALSEPPAQEINIIIPEQLEIFNY